MVRDMPMVTIGDQVSSKTFLIENQIQKEWVIQNDVQSDRIIKKIS